MAELLDAIEARLLAVVCLGRGTDGSLGSDAEARAIDAGRFRVASTGISLRDPSYTPSAFDRAVSLDWESISDEPDPANDYDALALRVVRFVLLTGVVYGPSLAAYAHTSGNELPATVVEQARRRALQDAERIRLALGFGALVKGGTNPTIVGIEREGPTTIEDIGQGMLVSSTPYRCIIEIDTTSPYEA